MGVKGKIKRALIVVILAVLAIVTIFPIWFLIVNSFKGQQEIVASPIALPKSWNLDYLKNAAEQINLGSSLLQTILITVAAVALIVIISSFAAWAIARTDSKVANILFIAYTAAMLIPFQSVMYPLVSLMDKLGLKNTPGLILMYGGFGISMSVLLYRGFIKSIPLSLEEAAMLDGANIFQIYRYVVMPLLKPTTMTVVITNAVWIWNDYLLPYLVIGLSTKYKTIPVVIQMLVGSNGNRDMGAMMAMLVLAIIPIVVFYLACQKHIIEGVVAGAVKG